MEILTFEGRKELLDYLPYIKSTIKEWQLVDVLLTEEARKDFTVVEAAKMMCDLFHDKEGKVYICNGREILMLIRWGEENKADALSQTVVEELPDGSCRVTSQEATAEGFMKVELMIAPKKSATAQRTLTEIRKERRENVLLVADDDMYMRMLVKKGAQVIATVYEVTTGDEVIAAYKKHAPDIILLDIHLPGKDGMDILEDLLALDRDAYIIMLSADSSAQNVGITVRKGAKGFLTKPFTRERLLEYIRQCPTIS